MRAISMFHNCEGQSHKTVSTDHNFWRERRAEADSNRGLLTGLTPSRYAKPAHLCQAYLWWSFNFHVPRIWSSLFDFVSFVWRLSSAPLRVDYELTSAVQSTSRCQILCNQNCAHCFYCAVSVPRNDTPNATSEADVKLRALVHTSNMKFVHTFSRRSKYSFRKVNGFSGLLTHSCTMQSFNNCWTLCFCTYASHSFRLCSSSALAAMLVLLTATYK